MSAQSWRVHHKAAEDMASTLTLPEAANDAHQQLPCWYAISTSPRHEKAVANQLGLRAVEHLLPVYREIHYWKQRRTQVELPLFPGYLFVRIALHSRLRVLEIPGVTQIVSFSGKPAALPDSEIAVLRTALALRRSQPHPYLTPGKRVRIRTGPLAGLEGVIDRQRSEYRMIVSVDFIQRSMSIELNPADLERI
jgi:transcription antitermination factor NusG